jgi:L-ribulokinase
MEERPSEDTYVVGVDFGTLSGRALVVRASDGAELGAAVYPYPHAVIEQALPATGEKLPPKWALQDPEDYRDVLRTAVPEAVRRAGIDPKRVVGIATDFTASTPMPTLSDGTPLCELPAFRSRAHAYPKLWKHHAAQAQAERVTANAGPRISRYGGRISSEWQFAKALQVLEEDPEVFARMDRWIEGADWIVWQLCGHETRNVCTAGYKGIHQDGAYPSREYCASLHADFADFVADKLEFPLSPLGARAGGLTDEAAGWTGLPAGIAVAIGNVDAHVTAPAAQATRPGQMVAIMGTSTCHVMNGVALHEVPGMCGVVEGGITPGLWGYEAGQSGVGDIFGWFVDHFASQTHEELSAKAARQRPGEHGLIALDWQSGNRSVLVDHELSGAIIGLTLATRPHEVYRALVEATAYGARKIVETFEASGVAVEDLVVAGGLQRNAFLMQIYADVLRRPLHLIGSEQGPALGSAIHAAVAAGLYPDIHAASARMGSQMRDAYLPDAEHADAYDELYAHYSRLHDHFGRGGDDVMHALRRPATALVA